MRGASTRVLKTYIARCLGEGEAEVCARRAVTSLANVADRLVTHRRQPDDTAQHAARLSGFWYGSVLSVRQ